LWPYAISGDLPIVLGRFSSPGQSNLARELIRAHAYWRRCGLEADLVLLHDADPAEELHDQLEELVRLGPTSEVADKPGGVFLRGAAEMPAADVMLLEAAARAMLHGDDGSLAEQLERVPTLGTLPADLRVTAVTTTAAPSESIPTGKGLLFANGLGGFTPDGREYVLTLRGRERPPAPGSNVLAKPGVGRPLTEGGGRP